MTDPISAAAVSAVSAATTKTIERFVTQATKRVPNIGKILIDHAAAAWGRGLQNYLEASYLKCKCFKSIANPNIPLDLLENYVNVDFVINGVTVSDVSLIDDVISKKALVVTGLAGSGKSMFMRYITLWHFENNREVTPLFVELRNLNNLTARDLLTYVRVSCVSSYDILNENQFSLLLREGLFLLLLDGFDELNYDIRDNIQQQIFDLRKNYPKTTVVLSSRPDNRFGAWREFFVYYVKSMNETQCLSLIDTIPYNDGVKKRFRRLVDEKLYETHKSFLSSPLLTTIMLLTFENFAEIPTKIYVFYGQAFDTLFQRHDAQKEQFQRKTYSGLPLEDFKAAFSVFCAVSYRNDVFSFNENTLLKCATAAIGYIDKPEADTEIQNKTSLITPENFVRDLEETVCMLQPDGLDRAFVHRSFQEYFTAKFVTQIDTTKIRSVVNDFSNRFSDSVIPMLLDMYREPMELEWVLPTIQKLESEVFDEILTIGDKASMVWKKARFDIFDKSIFMSPIPSESRRLNQMLSIIASYDNYEPFELQLNAENILDITKEMDSIASLKSNQNEIGYTEFRKLRKTYLRHMRQQRSVKKPGKSDDISDRFIFEALILDIDSNSSWWVEQFGLAEKLEEFERVLTRIKTKINKRETLKSEIWSEFF
jgi:hypothetical protein